MTDGSTPPYLPTKPTHKTHFTHSTQHHTRPWALSAPQTTRGNAKHNNEGFNCHASGDQAKTQQKLYRMLCTTLEILRVTCVRSVLMYGKHHSSQGKLLSFGATRVGVTPNRAVPSRKPDLPWACVKTCSTTRVERRNRADGRSLVKEVFTGLVVRSGGFT